MLICTGEPTNIVDCLKKGESEKTNSAVVFAMHGYSSDTVQMAVSFTINPIILTESL
jgi:hypothetical protein